MERAKAELKRIFAEARERWPIERAILAHRTGHLAVGETSLLMGVASAHRREAFETMQYIIDELKKRVPIWKRELYMSGKEEWLER